MTQPLVSVICLCYNHARFIHEAIASVLAQTYPAIEIIIVDDGSTDNSVAAIEAIVAAHPQIKFLPLEKNIGNCAAFNRGLAMAKGDYVVDFATDDVFLPQRIEKQVALFETLNPTYGVVFTDAEYIDEQGRPLGKHYDYLFSKGLLDRVPQGDVYTDVLRRYFICSPTMIVRRKVMDELRGYDETLAYEDFDFWLRSSRLYRYAFLNEALTRVRRGHKSMSTNLYARGDKQLYSTFRVCRKAVILNYTEADKDALVWRIRYEFRQAVLAGCHREAKLFYELLCNVHSPEVEDLLFRLMNIFRLPLRTLRRIYHAVRFGRHRPL
jgi:glycosyltransferase involved in cell wall biosynthesis